MKTYLNPRNKKIVKNLNDLDFSEFVDQLEEIKDVKPTTQDKKDKKIKNAERKKQYGYALVDGYQEKVGNFAVELPGLFMGRGKKSKTRKNLNLILNHQM